jgi:lysophospholipid acyltransferase (LPLAT)-like uncharacterized protein
VIPLAVGSSAGWRLGSWDGFLVPKPLSTVRISYLEPRFVPRDAPRERLEAMAEQIGSELDALTERLGAGSPGDDA